MALTSDIVESWRRPRAVIRRLQTRGRSEAFVFTFLFVFLLLAFTALAPYLSREAALHPEVPLFQRLFAAALGMLMLIPVFYLLAALGHLVARLLGGTGGYYEGRLALFWALTCTTPAMLVYGLMRAFANESLGVPIMGGVTFLVFLVLYTVMLREVEGQ
ncbi:MAG: YIP1 family protein [Cypionkella sp.]